MGPSHGRGRHQRKTPRRCPGRSEWPRWQLRPCSFRGRRGGYGFGVSAAAEAKNRRLLRARDQMDRTYPNELSIPALAKTAAMSEAHFIRSFRRCFGESPHRYLQRRRVERSMFLLRRSELSVTEVCLEAGFSSLGSFCRTFREVVGKTPGAYRRESAGIALGSVPTCFAMAWGRPSSFGEERGHQAVLSSQLRPATPAVRLTGGESTC